MRIMVKTALNLKNWKIGSLSLVGIRWVKGKVFVLGD